MGAEGDEVDGVVFYVYINSSHVAGDVDAVVIVPAAVETMIS